MRPIYRDEPCRTALNRVRGMGFKWSLNPYMGCVHQCTFCFVRAFQKLADRPSDARYGASIRVKTNVVEVLARELARKSWKREQVVVGTATTDALRAHARQVLAPAKRPKEYAFVSELPTTATGKVRRDALADLA